MSRTIILVTVRGRPDLTRNCLRHLIARTPRGERDIVVVDNGSRDETLDMMYSLFRRGDIYRILMNHVDTVPQWQKSYAIHQAVHMLRMETYDYFAWIDNDMEVETGWLDAARTILTARPDIQVCSVHEDAEQLKNHPMIVETDIAGHRVRLKETCNGALWVVRREFFDMYGLPPLGMGITGTGAEDWYYSRMFQERHIPFAVLMGYSVHHGRSKSARKVVMREKKC